APLAGHALGRKAPVHYRNDVLSWVYLNLCRRRARRDSAGASGRRLVSACHVFRGRSPAYGHGSLGHLRHLRRDLLLVSEDVWKNAERAPWTHSFRAYFPRRLLHLHANAFARALRQSTPLRDSQRRLSAEPDSIASLHHSLCLDHRSCSVRLPVQSVLEHVQGTTRACESMERYIAGVVSEFSSALGQFRRGADRQPRSL